MTDLDFDASRRLNLRQLTSWEELLRLELSADALAAEHQWLDASRTTLRTIARELLDHARHSFPGAPVYLATAPDRSNTLLRWRSRQPANRGGRLEIDDAVVVNWLAAAAVPQRKLFLKLDRSRCILNDHFSAVVYALQRQRRQQELRQRRITVLRQLEDR